MSASSPTFATLERARPLKPDGHAGDCEADSLAVLHALRQAGPPGVSTLEFLRQGIGGVRPPNRIHDLRKAGHLIETRRESGRQCRFVLLHENPSPRSRPTSKPAEQIPLSPYMARVREEEAQAAPLFVGMRP